MEIGGIGNIEQVRVEFNYSYGKLETPRNYRIEFWFEPLIFQENSAGLRVVTPNRGNNELFIKIRYNLKRWTHFDFELNQNGILMTNVTLKWARYE